MKALFHFTAIAVLLGASGPSRGEIFLGDANADGRIDIADAIYMREHTSWPPPPPCGEAGDVDGDHTSSSSDTFTILSYLFVTPEEEFALDPVCPFDPLPVTKLADFALGFEGPTRVEGRPGEKVTFQVFATLTTSGNTTDQGVEAWSFGFRAENVKVVSLSDEGTLAADPRVLSPFILYERVDPTLEGTAGPQGEGVVGAKVYDVVQTGFGLPSTGTARIAAINLQAVIPLEGELTGRLSFEDDLRGSGRPVRNVAVLARRPSASSGSHAPALGSLEIRFVPPDCNVSPDECDQVDCNGNLVSDWLDLERGTSADCNRNALPDECEIASGASADCNGNGIPDACDLRGVLRFEPEADHSGSETPTPLDLDGDGDLDLVLHSFEGTRLLENDGEGRFTPLGRIQIGPIERIGVGYRLKAADWNRDGKDDLAASADGYDGLFLYLSGEQGFREVRIESVPVHSLQTEDIDGDGHLDLAFVKDPNVLSVLFGDGTGAFPVKKTFTLGQWGYDVLILDLDSDGDRDLVAGTLSTTGHRISAFLNIGPRSFGTAKHTPVGLDGGSRFLLADLNRDGLPDAVADTSLEGKIRTFMGVGDGTFAILQDFDLAQPIDLIEALDLDGRRGLDLIASESRGVIQILLNEGDGSLSPPADSGHRLHEFSSIDTGDFDRDGDLDLAGLRIGSGFSVLLNAGDGSFPQKEEFLSHLEQPRFPPNRLGGYLLAADLDGHGGLDLVLSHIVESHVHFDGISVLLNSSQPPRSLDQDLDGAPDECPGGLQLPSDANQDASLDLGDAVWLLEHLFIAPKQLPCKGGEGIEPGPGNLALLDANGDASLDISDPVGVLGYLFLGDRPPPVLGTECVPIPRCPSRCRD